MVSEIDILVVHRVYGLLLFEIKDLREVISICDPKLSECVKTKAKTKKKKDRCPIKMINDAECQLLKKSREIRSYLLHFFKDEKTKRAWQQHWGVSETTINSMLDRLTSNEEMAKRSFICLFLCNNVEVSLDKRTFTCKRRGCSCKKSSSTTVSSNCQVFLNENLHSFLSFRDWWKSYFAKMDATTSDLPWYEFLLNRFGLDFYLSDFVCKYVDLSTADEKIQEATSEVKKEIFEKPLKQKIPILWDRLQKEALLSAQLSFVIGPPGSGKTILLVEKVRSLLKHINDDSEIDDRILIICGNNPALKSMVENSEEFLQHEKCCKRLYIFTVNEFFLWCEIVNVRFRHIFIDESQELDRKSLVKIMNDNFSFVQNGKRRHFWLLRDGSQNRRQDIRGFATEFYRNRCVAEVDLRSEWNQEENFFTAFYLKYVFRTTINQFRLFRPFMQNICCVQCKNGYQCGAKKIVCNYCTPWHGVSILGPTTLFLCYPPHDQLRKHSSADDLKMGEIVLHSIVKGWSGFNKVSNEVNLSRKINQLIQSNCIQKTAVITTDAKFVSDQIELFFRTHFIDAIVCDPKRFYECENKSERSKFLRVGTYKEFKGLEACVVVILTPFFVTWKKMNITDEILNYFLVSFSRANCLNVVLTTPDGKTELESIMSNQQKDDDCKATTKIEETAFERVKKSPLENLPLGFRLPVHSSLHFLNLCEEKRYQSNVKYELTCCNCEFFAHMY